MTGGSTKYTRPENAIYQFMDTVGDGSGEVNLIGDFFGTTEHVLYTAERSTLIEQLIVTLVTDMGTGTGLRPQDYGNIDGGLPTGWELEVVDDQDVVILDLTAGIPIKTNSDLGRVCFPDIERINWGAPPITQEVLFARWNFRASGQAILLEEGHQLRISLHDTFVVLLQHYFNVQGHQVW
jgi:hypothetical protein